MLLSFFWRTLSCVAIAASTAVVDTLVFEVPDGRPPERAPTGFEGVVPAEAPLPPPPLEPEPEELAVPNALVPGAVGLLTELPAPLGSLPELFKPPTLAGPEGTPLTAAVPAPAEPAFGDPTALLPAEGPLAAPPADPPPEPPPPPL